MIQKGPELYFRFCFGEEQTTLLCSYVAQPWLWCGPIVNAEANINGGSDFTSKLLTKQKSLRRR